MVGPQDSDGRVSMDGYVEARLEQLAEEHGLGAEAVGGLRRLLDLLERDSRAPTSVRDARRAVDLHVADSLSALSLPAVRQATATADIGAGAGFPGLPLAVALSDCMISLVESTSRKAEFLARCLASVPAPNARVVNRRVEQWTEARGTQDLVTARAVAPLAVLVEYAAPLLRPGGCLVAWKGHRDPVEERTGAHAAAVAGLECSDVRRVEPLVGAEHRHLYVYLKVRETPESLPRRAGMARKRPLGS